MFSARNFGAAAAATLAGLAGLGLAPHHAAAKGKVQAREQAVSCNDAGELAMLASPLTPWKGAPLRVMFASETAVEGELALIAPDGRVAATTRDRLGGPPYSWIAEVATPNPGKWIAKLTHGGETTECSIVVRGGPGAAPSGGKGVWPIRDAWNRGTENLYSAWIEKLFDAPLADQPSWAALHLVLRDKSRNFLFNYMGLGEDEKNIAYKPDCADLPYFLRAYFAFKMGLPFGYSKCSRGGGGKAPRCPQWFNVQKEETAQSVPDKKVATSSGGLLDIFGGVPQQPVSRSAPRRPQGLLAGFRYYVTSVVANGVHSGSGRTALTDDNTDYYPVALKQETLRPGTIYADPYGHVLVIAKRIPQTADRAGVFLAVDGQPDGTVGRKRFWRGNFLFAQDPALGGPGFKRFRPIVAGKNGELRRLTNAEIAGNADYGDFSLEQSKLGVEDFYDRMDDVMSPSPLDPTRALKEVITSLEEQVNTRVTSVENGRKYLAGGGRDVAMPDGASIFETTGAWEDFATPSRDLRLLIAIDVVRGFPDRVARLSQRYAMPAGKSADGVKQDLQTVLATEMGNRKFSYTRTDGSTWTLPLKAVLDRADRLEVSYNVNDCVELRWGAAEKSDEAATCKQRASEAQRRKMAQYRDWFHDRRRPPRN